MPGAGGIATRDCGHRNMQDVAPQDRGRRSATETERRCIRKRRLQSKKPLGFALQARTCVTGKYGIRLRPKRNCTCTRSEMTVIAVRGGRVAQQPKRNGVAGRGGAQSKKGPETQGLLQHVIRYSETETERCCTQTSGHRFVETPRSVGPLSRDGGALGPPSPAEVELSPGRL